MKTTNRLDPRPWHLATAVRGRGAAAAVTAWATDRGRRPWWVPLDGPDPLAALLAGLCAAGAPLDPGVVIVARHDPPLDVVFGRVVRPALGRMAEVGQPLAVAATLDGPPSDAARRLIALLAGEVQPPHHLFALGGAAALLDGLGVTTVEVDGDPREPPMPSMPSADAIGAFDALSVMPSDDPARVAWQRLRRGDPSLAAGLAAARQSPAAVEVEALARFALGEPVDALAPLRPGAAALAVAGRVLERGEDPHALDRLVAAAHADGWGWSPVAARLRWARGRAAWQQGALASALSEADAAGLRAALVGDDGLAVEAMTLAALVRAAQGDRDGAIGALRLAEQRAGWAPTARVDEQIAAATTRVARLLRLPAARRPPRAPTTDDGRWAAALARYDADPAGFALDPHDDGLRWRVLGALGALARGDGAPLAEAAGACRAAGVRAPLIELRASIEALRPPPAVVEATLSPGARRRPIRAAPRVPRRPLSPRELEVLGLAGRGLRNRQIGEALGIAPSTVGIHLRHAYDKLSVTRREAALRTARSLGLI
ncbi:MAG: helix-turn-helix transcriptional regulator [bacterium]